jgi:signal transduction histidine kinase/HAMP domain-containing protein/ActR/RegA family two-component response regulator
MTNWRDVPFRQKLLVLLLGFVTAPMLVVVIYNDVTSRQSLIRSTQARNLERAIGTATAVEESLANAWADVRTLSMLPFAARVCERAADAAVLRDAQQALRAVRSEHGFLSLYVTDVSGRVLVSSDDRVPVGSYETGLSFLSAVAGTSSVAGPQQQLSDASMALTLSYAIRAADGGIVGTVGGLIDVREIDRLIAGDTDYAGQGEFGLLMTTDGLPVSDPTQAHGKFASALSGVVERGRWLSYDGTMNPHVRVPDSIAGPLHTTIVPLPEQRWTYSLTVPESRALAALGRQTQRDLAVASFTVLVVLALSFVATGWVSTPLRRMTEAVNAMAAGDLHRRVALDQRDEIGQLAGAFNVLAASLAEKDAHVRAHTADLEARVAERTTVLELLENAGRVFGSSLDVDHAARELAALLVPRVAAFAAIEVSEKDGSVRRAAAKEAAGVDYAALHTVPLAMGEQRVGWFSVAPFESAGFDAGTESVLDEIARRTALFVANVRLYQEAQDANRLKDEFFGVVSHELRTPLNAILGWSRLADMAAPEDAALKKALDAVDRNAWALARLVDDLLDVPRIVTGKLTLDRHPADLVQILAAAVDGVRPSAASKGVHLALVADVSSASISADSSRLQQVFWNLLVNAVKFTPTGGRVRAHLSVAKGFWRVSVEDTGIGIAPEFLPRVFDRFTQADSSSTRAHSGLGIGLSIARHLVERHGGRITADSDGLNHGSVFTVLLPVLTARAIIEDQPAIDAAAATPEIAGLNVLVVDDEQDSRDALALLLTAARVDVVTVESVAAALRHIDASGRHPDIVLTDIGMPEEDGYALLSSLRNANHPTLRRVPVIAVTAYASPADRQRMIDAGFDEHVSKPVDMVSLVRTIARFEPLPRPSGLTGATPIEPTRAAGRVPSS